MRLLVFLLGLVGLAFAGATFFFPDALAAAGWSRVDAWWRGAAGPELVAFADAWGVWVLAGLSATLTLLSLIGRRARVASSDIQSPSEALFDRASRRLDRGMAAAARKDVEKALKIERRLARRRGAPEARRRLAAALAKGANLIRAADGPSAALAMHEESLDLRRALAEEVGTPEALRDFAAGLQNTARPRMTRDQAREHAVECLKAARAYQAKAGEKADARAMVRSAEQMLSIVEAAEPTSARRRN